MVRFLYNFVTNSFHDFIWSKTFSKTRFLFLSGWRRSKEKKCPENSDVCLHIHEMHFFKGGEYPEDEFCIDFQKDNWVTAEVCKKAVEHTKFK